MDIHGKEFWSELPESDSPDALNLAPTTLVKLHDYWLNVPTAACMAYADVGRMGVHDVKLRAGRAARILALAAAKRGVSSSMIPKGHNALIAAVNESVSEALTAGADRLAVAPVPADPTYHDAEAELATLRMRLWVEYNEQKPEASSSQTAGPREGWWRFTTARDQVLKHCDYLTTKTEAAAEKLLNTWSDKDPSLSEGKGRDRRLNPDKVLTYCKRPPV